MDPKTTQNTWKIVLKGMVMGAADVVPGVSGGTLALILGIYQRFLNALSAINVQAVRLLFTGKIKALWQYIDGTFLLCLFSGILLSIFTLTQGITYMIAYHPVILWAFFNGLILASLPHLFKQVNWSPYRFALLIVGGLFAWSMSSITPTQVAPTLPIFFGAGFIAICAMILPGISGSFLLLIMGMYVPITQAVSQLQFSTIFTFAAGCLTGLLAFSKLLNWALSKAFHAMLAFLIGIIIGSLPKIWPWQIQEQIVSPMQYYSTLSNVPDSTFSLVAIGQTALAFIAGGIILYLLHKIEKDRS